jgi:hypothetical protein
MFLGRFVRFTLGIALLWIFVLIFLPRFEQSPGLRNPTLPFLVAVAGSFIVLNQLVTQGLGLSWGRKPQEVAMVISVVLLLLDLVLYNRLWAPPLAWFLFLLTEVVLGFIGISLILAALLAVPG